MRSLRGVASITAIAAITLSIAMAGCSGGVDSSDGVSSAEFGEAVLQSAEVTPRDQVTTSNATSIAPQVIRTASLTIAVNNVTDTAEQIRTFVTDFEGTISSEDFTNIEGEKNANITAKVPAAELDAFIQALGPLGTVEQSNITATDVTTQVIDLDARISTLQSSIARLKVLQAQAETVSDLVAVETELANRQAELESIQSQRDYLGEQVALSTINIYLRQQVGAITQQPDFLRGLANGWNALLNAAGGLVTAAGFLLPFVLVVLVFILVVRLVRKRRRRDPR